MSLLRTLDRANCTSAVSPNAARPVLAFLCPAISATPSRRSFHKRAVTTLPPCRSSPSSDSMDRFFIHALARAASCQEHAQQVSAIRPTQSVGMQYHKSRRKSTVCSGKRQSSTLAGGPFKRVRQFAEKELRALVDYYGINLETGPEEDVVDDGSLVWNIGDDHEPWPVEETHQEHIAELEELLKDEEATHHSIFELYKMLPSPRIVFLRTPTIRTLLHHLSIVERVDYVSMQRFLSILDDMKNAHIHIKRSEWTSAIYLAGHFMDKVSPDEIQSALYLWRDMEQRAGVKGGTVTMNVLFDLAVRGGKYTLAETFLREMKARKLKLDRHFRTSLLYYYGVIQNGEAVRHTYQSIVSAGDVVDTVVMNAVISALIRAGEPSAAEHVFERMKRLNATKANAKPYPRKWRQRRQLGLHLTHEGSKLANAGEVAKLKEMQTKAPIAPDSRTYGLIIRHYAATAGNIDRVYELLQEMKYNEIPIEGTIHIVILYGFKSFGGVRYSAWTRDKLERIWADYLKSVQDGEQRTWFSSMSIIAGLKAFKKCTDEERTLQVWNQVREIWDPEPAELEKVLRSLKQLVPAHPFFVGNL